MVMSGQSNAVETTPSCVAGAVCEADLAHDLWKPRGSQAVFTLDLVETHGDIQGVLLETVRLESASLPFSSGFRR